MEPYWKEFEHVVSAVRDDHRRHVRNTWGHDFYHAVSVAQYAQLIAQSPAIGRLAWVAGICHNTDRLYAKAGPWVKVEDVVNNYLTHSPLSHSERGAVITAVLEHSKKNSDLDSDVTVTLKDADRLANLEALHLIRAGQFRPEIPVVDPRYVEEWDPTADFKNPKSHIRNLQHTLEWEGWMRLPKAKVLAAEKCAFVRSYITQVKRDLEAIGLYPYPHELLA